MDPVKKQALERRAKHIRRKTLDLCLESKEGHIGGCFSETEILISLYDLVLKPEDKFILSKGHACQTWYVLLREKDYNPKLAAHPDKDLENGICCTTGSLGHGLPIGTGMALARKIKEQKGKIYVLMGDGECQEGTTWETIPITTKYKLDNLTVIIDNNKLQALEEIEKVSPMNLKNIFQSFECYVREINGHDYEEIINALEEKVYDKPKIIIANTIKGKGISFMENNPMWHGRRPTPERLKPAYDELNKDNKK